MVRVDCDVIQADGGTRTAAITGAWVALHEALTDGVHREVLARNPMIDHVAAISIGIVEGVVLLDLDYEDDVRAEVDMNVVMSGRGLLIEVQGTAERAPFSVMNSIRCSMSLLRASTSWSTPNAGRL